MPEILMKYISRFDCEKKHMHGWRVAIRYKGGLIRKSFSDNQHGGREAAKQAAIKFRDQEAYRLGVPLTKRRVVQVSPRNKSGLIGIHRRRGCFVVSWPETEGRMGRIRVPIGDDEKAALRKVASIRREKEKLMFGSTVKANWKDTLVILNK